MLFGWKAAENLKTSRLSYQPDTAQWKRYFDVLSRSSLYNNTYVAAEDGAAAEGGDAFAAVAAVAVGLLPLAFVGYRVLLAQQVL